MPGRSSNPPNEWPTLAAVLTRCHTTTSKQHASKGNRNQCVTKPRSTPNSPPNDSATLSTLNTKRSNYAPRRCGRVSWKGCNDDRANPWNALLSSVCAESGRDVHTHLCTV